MLIRGSAESQGRTLSLVGLAVVLIGAALAGFSIVDPFSGRTSNTIDVAIDTPFIVQGVAAGTAVMMHGVQVGTVTAVSSSPEGGARLDANLKEPSVKGLTDAMKIDFRPANYFGVTGVNITPVAGGRTLYNGIRFSTVPTGDNTLQALLTRLGKLSTGVVTSQLVDVIDKATRYADGLIPFIETVLIAANTLAEVQDTPTIQLLNNATGVAVAFPSLLNETTNLGDFISTANDNWIHQGIGDLTEEQWVNDQLPAFELAATKLFGSVGALEGAHVYELLPLVNGLKSFTDVIPPLVRPEGFAQTMVELRTRFEQMYGGTPEQRALRVRIVLDELPGVAAPLGVPGVPR